MAHPTRSLHPPHRRAVLVGILVAAVAAGACTETAPSDASDADVRADVRADVEDSSSTTRDSHDDDASAHDTETTVDDIATADTADAADTAVGDTAVEVIDSTDAPADSADAADGDTDAVVSPGVWRVSRGEDSRLTLESPLPARTDDCASSCADVDLDGLVDEWEDGVLERLRPVLVLDESESLVDDATAVLHHVGRVALLDDAPLRVHVYVMIGYSRDYGSCGFTDHHGDSERVAVELVAAPGGGPGDVVATRFYTAAHEGTSNDHGAVYDATDPTLAFDDAGLDGDVRWLVYPSADKHATYASIDVCENVAAGIPCLDEDCAPDGVADPSAFVRWPPIVNAGEPDAPRLTALDAIGFPGDDAWADQPFCGGLGDDGCSAPVRDKLTIDPFGPPTP